MPKQLRYTKNVRVAFYLIECEHEATLTTKGWAYCVTCQKAIKGKFVGKILASLDKDGFLSVRSPLRIKAAVAEAERVIAEVGE